MLNFAEVNVARRERPVGICPRCHTIIRTFDQIGKKCAKPLAIWGEMSRCHSQRVSCG